MTPRELSQAGVAAPATPPHARARPHKPPFPGLPPMVGGGFLRRVPLWNPGRLTAVDLMSHEQERSSSQQLPTYQQQD